MAFGPRPGCWLLGCLIVCLIHLKSTTRSTQEPENKIIRHRASNGTMWSVLRLLIVNWSLGVMYSKGPGPRFIASSHMACMEFFPSKNLYFSLVFTVFRAPQGGPANRLFEVFLAPGAKIAPRWLQDGSKMPQVGQFLPNWASAWPHDGSTWPNWTSTWLNLGQVGFHMAQFGPPKHQKPLKVTPRTMFPNF